MTRRLDELLSQWEEVARSYAHLGATQAPTHEVMERLLYHAFHNSHTKVPKTVGSWQIFADRQGAHRAAAALHDAAQACINYIDNLPLATADEVRDVLVPYCKQVRWQSGDFR